MSSFAADKPAPAGDTPAEAREPAKEKPATDDDWLYIDNGSIKLGVKKSSGAGIGWLSESKSERNLVNNFDRGRLIQQSYYGKEDGSMWDKQPWAWNPVQGGDWKGNPAKVLELKSTTNSIYARTQARHWASGAELPEVVFEERITLASRVVVVRYRMIYSGTETHPVHDQEIPAVFLSPELDTLVLYDGDQPWSEAPVSRSKPGWPNEARKLAENWAAYVDKDDFGVGAYVPKASGLTCYRYGDGRAENGSCSYFAPLAQFAITPGKVFEYDLYLMVGTSKEFRENVYKLYQQRRSSPPGFAPAAKP